MWNEPGGPRAADLFGRRSIVVFVIAMVFLLAACGSVEGPSSALGPSPSSPSGAAALPVAAPIEAKEWNFRYRIQDPHWIPIDRHPAVPNARFVMSHEEQPVWFAIAVDPDPKDGTTPEAIARTFGEQIAATGAVAHPVGAEPLTLDGIAGFVSEWVVSLGSESARYLVWVGSHGGSFYRLFAWADAAPGEPRTTELMHTALAGFSILDRNGAAGPGGALVTLHRSAAFGYSVDLREEGWREWTEVQEALPGADWGAVRSDTAVLAVMPYVLADTGLPRSAVEDALIELLGRQRPAEFRSLSIGDLQGIEFEYDDMSGGRALHYRVHVLVAKDRAFLNLAWADLREEGGAASLSVLDRIRYEPVAADVLPRVESLPPARQRAHGRLLHALGVRLTERAATGRAMPILEQAARLVPDDPNVLASLVLTSILAGRHVEALAALDATPIDLERTPQLIAYRAVARARVGAKDAARADFAAAFAAGVEDEGFFELWMELLLDSNRADEALQQLDRRIDRTRSARLRGIRARVLRITGDLDGAADELRSLVETEPWNRALHRERIDVLHEQKAHEAALAACREALESVGPTAEFHVLAARSLQALGRIREAREALEQALALEPDDLVVRQSLEYLSTSIGEGANSLVRRQLEPVPIPAEVSRGKGVTPSDAEIEAYGAWYRRWVQGVRFEAGKELRRTTELEIIIASRNGVVPFASFEIDFQPLAEELYVNRLEVHDETGAVIARGDPSQFYVLDSQQLGGTTSVKKLHVPVPGVRPGVTIDFVYTKRERRPPREFPLVDQVFTARVPVAWAALYIAGDIADLSWNSSPALRRDQDRNAVWWSLTAVPAYPLEPLQQRPEQFLPRVVVASAGQRWEVVARNYLDDLKDLLPAPEEVARLAEQNASEDATVDERARAIAATVQQRLAYKALEFGPRARIPPPSDETLHRAFGDCKDHALLIVQMMRSAGIDADLALVNLGKDVDASLPSLDQFDHMIAYCADCQRQRFFDATGKDLPLGVDAPLGLAGKTALILDAENPRLEQIPEHDEAYHWAVEERVVQVTSDGDLEIHETLRVQGVYASALRQMLRGNRPGHAREVVQNLLGKDAARALRTVEVSHLDEPDEPLRIDVESRVPLQFSVTPRALVGRLPVSWARTLIGIPPVESRVSPFTIPVPVRFSSRTRVSAPAGYDVSSELDLEPDGADGADGAFVAWRGSRATDADGFVVGFELERASGDFSPKRYGQLFDETERALAFLQQTLIFEQVAAPDRSASVPRDALSRGARSTPR